MIADLPDLSHLSLGQSHDESKPTPISETLLDKLSAKNGGKTKGCNNNEFPIESKDYDSTNCAIDGYLMVKTELEYAPTSPFDPSALNRNYEVKDRFGKTCTMKALPRYPDYSDASPEELQALTAEQRDDQLERRTKIFTDANKVYLDTQQNFRWRCIQDKRTRVGMTYDDNIYDLCKYTDFYYIDKSEKRPQTGDNKRPPPEHQQPQPGDSDAEIKLRASTDRGFIFLSVLDSPDRKNELELPSEGVYEEPYLYIIVVCAAGFQGYGKVLMTLAERFAAQIGLDRIVLAGLPNALGAYWGLGYRFYPWDEPEPFKVPAKYLREVIQNRKRKTMLKWDLDDGLKTALRKADRGRKKRGRSEAEDEDEGGGKRSVLTKFWELFRWWNVEGEEDGDGAN